MAKKYDVVATVGKYEKDGQTKYVNRNVGAVITTDKGFKLVLDASFNPAGCPKDESGKVWLSLFEPRVDNQQPQQQTPNQASYQAQQPSQQSAPRQYEDFEDDIPFNIWNPINGL